ELAMQVRREFEWLYAGTGAVLASCVGGMDMRTERRALERGAHIVVGTPGRLRDHIQRESIDLSAIRAVVLDEADEMLDLGFAEDLEFILGTAPDTRRTLMFSATVPREIERLSKTFMREDAQRVKTTSATPQHADIEYRVLSARPDMTEGAVINTLRFYDAQNAIIFCNTRAMVSRLTARLSNRGFQVVALSGELSQSERSHALQAMRDGRARVCVATDVAARGIDLPGLDLVIHADLPNNSETLLHRSGRTGRAGRKGVSALFVTHRSQKKADRLLRFAKVKAEWGPPPSAEDVREKDRERMLADPVWTDPAPEDQKDFIQTLAETFSAEQLARAYLALYEMRHSAPEDLEIPEKAEKREREPFGASAWVGLSIGHDDRAEPRWLLPMLCRAGNIGKDDIGAIRIQDKETFVEMKAAARDRFMDQIGTEAVLEQGIRVVPLDKAPELPTRPAPKPGARAKRVWGKPEGKGPRDKPYKKRDDAVHSAAAPRKSKGKEDAADFAGKPRGKKKWDKPAAGDKPAHKGKPGQKGKPGGKPGKRDDSAKPAARTSTFKKGASDPSARMGKGKPKRGAAPERGPNAMPRRKK
ncbi:MAG: DEAD/DEAH box helicase, partial [Thalassovita sp.]|nr:DEAD/DEAH box helicase [Thalassovita sp.]